MKKKLIFAGIIVLALVLTSSTFAYTYTNTTVTSLPGTFADGAWATFEPSTDPPDWQQVMPNGMYDAEILRPCGPGDQTDIASRHPDEGDHWDKVDDTTADDGQTCLCTGSFKWYQTDLFALADHTPLEEGVVKDIKSIAVFFRLAGSNDKCHQNAYAKAVIKMYGSIYEGKEEIQSGGDYVTRSYQWRGNPATGRPWTWDDADKLQAGISLKGDNGHRPAYVTQVYIAVNYEKKVIQSEVPPGDLFDITPHPDYAGDLQVKIYLTNTADLIRAYSYLNMELYMAKSLEAKRPPIYRILSLENGVASFNIEGGSARIYTVEVRGGAYRLISSNTADWGTGWSVIPELYCEVTQR